MMPGLFCVGSFDPGETFSAREPVLPVYARRVFVAQYLAEKVFDQ
jgi:hypothetical protein